ncbi:MAG: aminotransferase class I/II-fold pyridoxal phosphate-dependent enzyme [Pirellulales bacterium]|nr:aminotransferase class I/II-fold pyridoxal phosphate-dependent enzyme [Pirellulales bacterium]
MSITTEMHRDLLPGSFFGPSNLVDLLQHRAMHQGHDRAYTFLVDGENEELHLTYRELDRQARAIGARLQAEGYTGERAILLYPAGLDFIAAFFGCLYAGVVAVPAYPPRRNRNLQRIQGISVDAQARVALTNQETLNRTLDILDETPHLRQMKWLATDQLEPNGEKSWQKPLVNGQSLAFLQYTSGSTGSPKGVVLTHSNLLHNSALISYAFEHTRSEVGMFWLPCYHDMGLIGGILQPLYAGQPNVLMSPVHFLTKPFRWLQAISRYRATISGGPNFAYDLCLKKVSPQQRDTLDLSYWRLAFNGAEPVRENTLEAFARFFGPCGFRREAFYPCYGMAENTLIVSGGFRAKPPVVRYYDTKGLERHQIIEAAQDDPHSRPLVGCGGHLLDEEIVIANPQTLARCQPDEVGEVWVAGPSVAQGYWNQPELSRQIFQARLSDSGRGPYLRTGDMGFLRDGELFITGRLKDMLIFNGVNHYPQDIEETLEICHPDLKAGACAAFAMERDGREALMIVVEIERGKHRGVETFQPLYAAMQSAIAVKHELPVSGIILIKAGSIPKTSSGKIQRHACKGALVEGSLEIIDQWWSGQSHAPQNRDDGQFRALPSEAGDLVLDACGFQMNGQHSFGQQAPTPPHAQNHRDESAGRDHLGMARGHSSAAKSGAAAAASAGGDYTENVAKIVFEQVRRVAKERAGALTLDTNILELGLDSIERMEIVSSLEDIFGGRFPEAVLTQMETCGEVVRGIEQYLGKTPRQKGAAAAEIPPEAYNFELYPEYLALKQNMANIAAAGVMNPYFKQHERITNDTTLINGRELINWSSYNYLGMSGDPVVRQAAQAAIDQYGTSVSASRLVSGEKPLHRELEQFIARFVGVEDAIVYVGGHSTNETTIGHLLGPGDLVLHDSLAHNSIIQGCLLSGARRRPFPHNDWQALARLLADLRGDYRRVLIVIEGVYSMDGDYPALPEFVRLKQQHKCFLMVDEAHSAGTMGSQGRGIAQHFGLDPREIDIWMGTLSKSYGSCGGYIAGSRALVEYLKYTSPGFVYSVGISPPNAAAALAAMRLLTAEPQRVARLHANARLFLHLAQAAGLNTGSSQDSPVVPVILGNSLHCLRLSQALFQQGINVQPILYPAVEESAARLRFFITSLHSEAQIRRTVQAVGETLGQIDPRHLHQAPTRLPATRGPQVAVGGKDA